jgi:hypothetical protein
MLSGFSNQGNCHITRTKQTKVLGILNFDRSAHREATAYREGKRVDRRMNVQESGCQYKVDSIDSGSFGTKGKKCIVIPVLN